MKKGILIYAHNNRSVDYALMALISGGLAKKKLNVHHVKPFHLYPQLELDENNLITVEE